MVDDVAEEEEDIEVIYGDMDDMDNMKDGEVSRLGPFSPQLMCLDAVHPGGGHLHPGVAFC